MPLFETTDFTDSADLRTEPSGATPFTGNVEGEEDDEQENDLRRRTTSFSTLQITRRKIIRHLRIDRSYCTSSGTRGVA